MNLPRRTPAPLPNEAESTAHLFSQSQPFQGKYCTPWSKMVPGLKRPYSDEEGVSSAHPPTSVKKRELVSASEAVGANLAPAASTRTTASIDICNTYDTYRDDIKRAHGPYPVPWASSPSSDDALEVPSSAESTWTPATSTSNAEGLEIRNESNEIEICFGMVGSSSSPLSHSRCSPRE